MSDQSKPQRTRDNAAETSVPWDLPVPFVIDLTVDDSHIDGLGHVNNTVYVEWCGRVAWEHTKSHDLDLRAYKRLDRAMVIRETRLNYLGALFKGERVQVANWIVASDGKLRVTRRYQIVRLDDMSTVIRGYSRFVCAALSSGRPKRMPKEFQAAYVVEPEVAAVIDQRPLEFV